MNWNTELVADAVSHGFIQLEGEYMDVDYVQMITRLLLGDFGDVSDELRIKQAKLFETEPIIYGLYEDWAGSGMYALAATFSLPFKVTVRFYAGVSLNNEFSRV